MFSIVVPTFCSEKVIVPLLESLVRQSNRDFELVLSDGASPDATTQVVETFREQLPSLTVDSRVDTGIYDAINIGIGFARGRWVLVMGADDQLASHDVLEKLKHIALACDEPIIYGDVRIDGSNGMVPDGSRYGGQFTLARILGQNICQQAMMYRRDIFDSIGMFDTRYRLWADWHFALKAFNAVPTRWVDLVVAVYGASGASSRATDSRFQADFKGIVARLMIERPPNVALLRALMKRAYWRLAELSHRP